MKYEELYFHESNKRNNGICTCQLDVNFMNEDN